MTPNPTSTADSRRVLVTAGPTHEPIDAVRYLANHSSGRMGLALAEAAAARGLDTTLLLGPTQRALPDHSQLTILRFQTTADLQHLLSEHWPVHDVLFMAAAVADYRPIRPDPTGKLRRTGEHTKLDLEPTPDLLAEITQSSGPHQVIIGFALEPPDGMVEGARAKLAQKGLHAIVANPLETMDSERISASLLLADGRTLDPPPDLTKTEFARWLLDQLPVICTFAHAESPEQGD